MRTHFKVLLGTIALASIFCAIQPQKTFADTCSALNKIEDDCDARCDATNDQRWCDLAYVYGEMAYRYCNE